MTIRTLRTQAAKLANDKGHTLRWHHTGATYAAAHCARCDMSLSVTTVEGPGVDAISGDAVRAVCTNPRTTAYDVVRRF